MEIDELIGSINIVDFISQYVDLEKRGDEWWGLSCFKDEKTPSFSVRENPPFFYDYSSGLGGNVFNFVKYYFNCSSRTALDILKKFAGYDGDISVVQRPQILNVMKKYASKNTPQKQSSSVVLPEDYMNRFEKRDSKLKIWIDEGISKESLDRFQVRYDPISDRLVYPIRNMDGRIVNVGGRAVNPNWKSLGERKYTYFFQWGTINTIYGAFENMDEILKKREIILFEGCKSVLLADTWGIRNTGAILTSHLSSNNVKILASLGVDAVFALDNDVDVKADKNIRKLSKYINVYFIRDTRGLLDTKDSPVDKGHEVFEKLYESRRRF